ncbi:MAG: TonB-dependent receptor, partial [Muribaculaceae bacterium]|nr:TonB-dependent receptor [Muribaculaceae bacterium]
IAGLNADDIESFQILKDGSATSIYGAKAMAGVIVVTTKTGRSGHTSINYTGEFTYRLKPMYRDFNICNSQEQMGIYKEMEQKGWLEFASIANNSNTGIYGYMYNLLDTYDPVTGKYLLENTTKAKNAYLREAEMRNTDWFDLLFNDNIMQNHAVSVSGGTDKGSFYTSMSLMNDPGWTRSSRVERYTFNANAIYNISPKVRVKILNSDSYRRQRAPGTLSQDVDVVNGEVKRDFDINPYSYALNTSRTLDPNIYYRRNYTDFNIFHELDNNYIDLGVTDLKFQGEINIKPVMTNTQSLEINLLGSYRYSASEQNHIITEHSNQAMAYRAGIDPEDALIRGSNTYLYTDPDDPNSLPQTVLPKGGMLFYNKYSVSQYDFRATATYQQSWHDSDHVVNVMAGAESSKVDRVAQAFEGWGIVYGNGNLPFMNFNLFKQMQEENGSYYSYSKGFTRNMAYFGTARYGYKARYILTGTLRYEGSNRMGKTTQSRWLPTWNVSGAWNMHDEPFFQRWGISRHIWTHAKFRASYSLTAESGPTSVANAEALYYPSRPWRQETETQEMGLSLDGLANTELTYEKKHELDLGVDLAFLSNRINLEFDWYKRDNFDLIGRIYTQGVGGVTSKYANVAEMSSHGVEFTLTTHNIQPANPADFSWSTDFTFAYAKNKITKLVSRSRIIDLVQGTGFPLQGYPVRAIFSIPFVGLNAHGEPQIINEDGNVTTSDINFQEFEKLAFMKYEGPVDPLYTGGLNNSFSWKGLHLNVFMTYSFGNKLRLSPDFSAAYSDLTAMPKEFKNRWVMPGDEEFT